MTVAERIKRLADDANAAWRIACLQAADFFDTLARNDLTLPTLVPSAAEDVFFQPFDCHYDGDINRCDKDCRQLGGCKRRMSGNPPSSTGAQSPFTRVIDLINDINGDRYGKPLIAALHLCNDLADELTTIQSATGGSSEDDKRFAWLALYVFDRKWDGTIGRQPYWQMAGPYRHELMKMRGNTLRDAIDEAMKASTDSGVKT